MLCMTALFNAGVGWQDIESDDMLPWEPEPSAFCVACIGVLSDDMLPWEPELSAFCVNFILETGNVMGLDAVAHPFYSRPMTNTALKSKTVTIRMTGALYANLKRIAGPDKKVAEIIREAVRQYIDDRGEVTGSRRHFTGRFREEVRGLRRDVVWLLILNTIMLAEIGSILILTLVDMDEETAKTFMPGNLLRIAEERLVESGWRVQRRVEVAVDEAELESQRATNQ